MKIIEYLRKFLKINRHYNSLDHIEFQAKSKMVDFDFSSVFDSDPTKYRSEIERLASTGTNFFVPNSNNVHARIILSNIFKQSNSHIKILAKNLCGDVSKDEYITELESAINRKIKIEIKLESNSNSENSKAIELIRQYKKNPTFSDNVSIGLVKTSNLELLKLHNKKMYNFCVGDSKMFRLETDTENYVAIANFNDSFTCNKLTSIFDNLQTSQIE